MSYRTQAKYCDFRKNCNEKQILNILNNIYPRKRKDIDNTGPVCHTNEENNQYCYYPEHDRLYSDFHAYHRPYKCYPVYTLIDQCII